MGRKLKVRKEVERIVSQREKSLEKRPVRSVVESLGKLSLLWLKKDYFYRKKALQRLVARSGFTENMAEVLLDSLFKELTAEKLWLLLKAELKDPFRLDGFRRDPLTKKFVRARGPRLITHVFAGNVPNPSVLSFVFGMLVKSANAGKVSGKDPGFLDIYLESLLALDPPLGGVNFLLRPEEKASVKDFMKESGLVVAYGNDETLAKLKQDAPSATPFLGYGHRMSFGLYTREVLTRKNSGALAERTALDIWMVDQRGCLSPLVLYVEAGGKISPVSFARLVAQELERLSAKGSNAAGRSFARIASSEILKSRYKMRKLKGENVHYWESKPRGQWAVFCDAKVSEIPSFTGNQVIYIKEVRKPEEVYKALFPLKKYLQAAALEAVPARRHKIGEALANLGVNRICRAGKMQSPPVLWHHDGKPNLVSWVSWADLET